MEKERDKKQTRVRSKDSGTGDDGNDNKLTHPVISTMKPLTHEAYGGGMYGKDDDQVQQHKKKNHPPASETQSADGPSEPTNKMAELKNKPPPSSGDRDIDITGQSYIQ
uniref:uncharacterized protein LOC122586476 n=1 Tax=Erigeron canadensis TaxID=72917 RepID=UPI001CB960C2|nr:uncharacterized protein LOC122586476 [Erigeron canadensis]